MGSSKRQPRLVDNSLGERGNYCTLSYHWHSDQLRTEKATLEQHKQEIPLTRLYAPISDAIFLTRELGICYLWVDALCICQDDDEEKQTEIAKMDRIYHNSFLTISAIDSALFVERKGHKRRNERRIRPRGRSDTRGWVLQEQVLSRRVLSYSDGEVFWNCLQLRASEGCPSGISNLKDVQTVSRSEANEWGEKELNIAREAITCHGFDDGIGGIWNGLVEDFTLRDLGKEEDRHNAMLGLATAFGEAYAAKVVAGMLLQDLNQFVEQLIWWVLPPVSDWYWASDYSPKPLAASLFVRPDPMKLIAPTWSWLSMLGPVSYQAIGIPNSGHDAIRGEERRLQSRPEFSWSVKIHEVILDPCSTHSNVMGSIRLTGLLTRARIRHSRTGSLFRWSPKERYGWFHVLGLEGRDFPPAGNVDLFSSSDMQQWSTWYPDIPPPPCSEIFCLHLGVHGPGFYDPSYSLCLVPTDAVDTYERIGMCNWKPVGNSGSLHTITIV